MIAIGVARPRAHGQAIISTATALTRACAKRGSGPKKLHATNVSDRNCNHRRNKPRSHSISQPLNRSAAALRLADHLHDPRQQRLTAHTFGAHDQRPGSIHRRPNQPSSRLFADRNGFASNHRLVHRASAFEHRAIYRNLLAGTHAQPVTGPDLIERDVFFDVQFPARPSGASVQPRANFGERSSRARMAAPVRLRARSSSTWPSSTSVVIAAAASK